ncbi:MAG: replicative DNA helicase [Firmicutes bacterium]|nr:replicative DNA helicase [Bacillota bacterium]
MDTKQSQQKQHPNISARILPSSYESEQAVLGCVLIDEYAPSLVLTELNTSDFMSFAHREIFNAAQHLTNNDKPVDALTVAETLKGMGSLDSIGGIGYLNQLTNLVPSASNLKHYTGIVKKTSILRKLIESANKISDKAYTGDIENNALAFAEAEIFSLAEKLDSSKLKPSSEGLREAISRMEMLFRDPDAARGIPTGFKRLDRILNGFQKSDLVLVAARPGQGKTSIGMNFILNAALNSNRRTDAGNPNPYKCAVFSLEMGASQIAKRMLCARAKVNMKGANSGDLKPDEWKRIYQAKSGLDKAHIYIDDSSLTTPIEILSKCRRLKREKGLDLVMVDYLQLMSSGKNRIESRQQEVAEITRTMKIAAKELDVPIILLSQMSRDIEKRGTKKAVARPQMSDLRESGAIEQDADIILFIHREHDSNDRTVDEVTRSKVELIIAKHRNGETGSIDLKWQGEYTSFVDVDYSPEPPPPSSQNSQFTIHDDNESDIPLSKTENKNIAGVSSANPKKTDNIPPEPSPNQAFAAKTAKELLDVKVPTDDDDIF